MRKRSFSPLRDLPALAWLLFAVVVALAHPLIPDFRWLLLHAFFLGALTHSVLVWSQHFATALLRSPTNPTGQRIRLAASNLGAIGVITGLLLGRWEVVAVGATAVGGAVIWHGADLAIRLGRALGSRFAVTIRFYIAAAAFLAFGAVLGVLLSRAPSEAVHARLILAHSMSNVLGWIGLTVFGTLLTLWPTILRTRIHESVIRLARRMLPALALGLLATVVGALLGRPEVVTVGLVAYLVGASMAAFLMIRTARTKHPTTYAAFSVALGTTWLLGCIVTVAVGAARGIPGDIAPAAAALRSVAPLLAAGAGVQILLGALSYLMPVQLSKGPASSRAANAAMDKGGIFRVALANAALVLYVLPTPSTVSVIASAAYLGCMVAFVPLMVGSIRAARRHAPKPLGEVLAAADGPGSPPTRPGASPAKAGSGVGGPVASERRSAPQLIAALGSVLAIVVAGVAVDPASAGVGRAADDGVQPNGRVETVQVVAADMRFSPSVIEVEAGTELVIEVTNEDDAMVHDLVLATGDGTPRLAPGESATIDVGVVGTDIDGWCSIVGHRQQGMTLQIVATGSADQADAHAGHGDAGHAGDESEPPATVDHGAEPGDDFEARDAELPPLPDQDAPVTHRATWEITEEQIEIAPGVTQELWTFDGSVPGPVLHGRVGDRFEITIVNNGTMGHSIDFHASQVAPDGPMRTIAVGESLTYEFTAQRSGIWMYHCSTAPVSAHIANGMAGAVIIEPDGLEPVDRSFVFSQAEYYLGPEGGTVDVDALASGDAGAIAFNGYVHQYQFDPVEVAVGERVRIWVLDIGPSRATSFHVIGEQFDTVWFEGDYLLDHGGSSGTGGSQALGLQPAQGGFVELEFDEDGHYPFMTHAMVDAELGAHGVFDVGG